MLVSKTSNLFASLSSKTKPWDGQNRPVKVPDLGRRVTELVFGFNLKGLCAILTQFGIWILGLKAFLFFLLCFPYYVI